MEGQTGKRLDVEFGKKQGRRISPSSGLCSPGKRSARKSAHYVLEKRILVQRRPCPKNGLGYIVGCVLELVTICCSKYCIVFAAT